MKENIVFMVFLFVKWVKLSVNFSKKNYCAEGKQLQNYTVQHIAILYMYNCAHLYINIKIFCAHSAHLY
jgi:hypothetical protein